MSDIVIIYHSGYGHTKRIAEAVAEGAKAALVAIDPEGNVSDDAWERLAGAKAIVFGAPTYMGGASWQFKKFADASSKVWFTQGWKDKLAAGFTTSSAMSGDKLSTLHYLYTLSQQHSMLWVSLGQMPSNLKAHGRNDPNYNGAYSGLMSTTPADAPPEDVPAGDLETARRFGARIAGVVAKFAG